MLGGRDQFRMGINIYVGKENLPENIKFVHDVDAFFVGMPLQKTPFTSKVLQEVEQSSFCDAQHFKDRFGHMLPVSCLSTSSKIILAVARYHDVVINCSEVGRNAIDLLLEVPDASLYFKSGFYTFRQCGYCDVFVNGVHCETVETVNYRMSLWEG